MFHFTDLFLFFVSIYYIGKIKMIKKQKYQVKLNIK